MVGASAGLGRALADALASRGHNLMLLATDERDLAIQSADLMLRFNGIRCPYAACKLDSSAEWKQRVIAAAAKLPQIDGVLFPIGYSQPDDSGTLDEASTRQIMEANLLGIIVIASLFLPEMLARGTGCIVGFGSIASIRGRKSNIVYSAAKRGLASYFESLRHLAAGTRVRVQFYQLGYLDTQQSFGKKLLFPKCDPNELAHVVASGLDKDFGTRFYPRFWALVDFILRSLPWFIFKRLSF